MKKIFNFSFLVLALSLVWSCSNAPEGEKIAAEDAQETTSTPAEKNEASYTVDTEKSVINWTGTKPGGAHTGTLNLTKGSIGVLNGNLISGMFTLDMTSIKNTDLPEAKRGDLEGHLKTGDFFEVDKHPTGEFLITQVTTKTDVEGATHTVTGNLTLKGISKSVSIPANINVTDAAISVVTPAFTIDRTEWGITYNSGTLESTVKERILNDEIGLVLQVVATANQVQ